FRPRSGLLFWKDLLKWSAASSCQKAKCKPTGTAIRNDGAIHPARQARYSEIYNWLVDRNPVAVRQVEDFVRKVSLGLAEFPMMGVPTDLAQVRRLPLVRYPTRFSTGSMIRVGTRRREHAR